MARPCCEAKTQLPELHAALVPGPYQAPNEEHLRWFFDVMRIFMNTADVDDAHTVSRIGDRHDIGDQHLNMLVSLMADYLTWEKDSARAGDAETANADR